jgi:aryl-alcohol dehydrogenase-like predicted oxidoreductase
MKYNKLGNTDLFLSELSYGASPLGSVFGEIDESVGIETVHKALDWGINYIDCSPYYGLTKAETVLGKALKGVARDKYILSSKAGRYGAGEDDFDMSEKRIRSSLDESLKRLGVDELDIFLLHDIEFVDLDYILNESLPCLEALKKEGRIRYYGVTGYPLKSLQYIVNHYPIDCLLSYCRFALHDQSLQALLSALREKNIGVINASPTAMGLLTDRGEPTWHPASQTLKQCSAQAKKFCIENGVDLTQLAMQYAVSDPSISSTLVGTANPENLKRNIKWVNEPADQAILEQVLAIFSSCQSVVWPSGKNVNSDV